MVQIVIEQGEAYAQKSLGDMYVVVMGSQRILIYAYMWLTISDMNQPEFSGALSRNLITKYMSDKEVSTAQDLARECVRKKYKGC